MAFLDDLDAVPVDLGLDGGHAPSKLFLGGGKAWQLEVVHVPAADRPTASRLREVWRKRSKGRPSPLIVAATVGDRAHLCGPSGDEPGFHPDVPLQVAERICRSALDEPDYTAAIRFLRTALPEAEAKIPGLRNEGLLATHVLREDAPKRPDWADAGQRARAIADKRGPDLVRSLGFAVRPTETGRVHLLLTGDRRTALAVFLDRTELHEGASQRFGGASPVSYALSKADEEGLPWVVATSGATVRLYPVKPGVGIASRGRSETFIELHLGVLDPALHGYLWLLLSAPALAPGGTFDDLLGRSERFAADLGRRLRERIYEDVIGTLGEAIADARKLRKPSTRELERTYRATLTLLFRILFVAYAEDKDLLPYRANARYRGKSLKSLAREILDVVKAGTPFDTGPQYWAHLKALFRAVDRGNTEWGVPAYNGGLFTGDGDVSEAGAILEEIELGNDRLGPALQALLLEQTDDRVLGPVDFRSLSVREFGTIYEGLLECELSVAEEDLTLDKDERYRPVRKAKDKVEVRKGRVYLHGRGGGRKASGSYYTKDFAVEHLLDQALEPALREHLARLDEIQDPARAAERLFDFRVADIAMGSGHFLVAAVDHVERGLSQYLAKRPLQGVRRELDRLRTKAGEALGDAVAASEIEDTQLLRRQIARRCIYGVDLNAMAVDLARLSVWVHTFVPGLPLSFLDHNLKCGNSLVGIATFDEAEEIVAQREMEGDVRQRTLFGSDHFAKLLERGAAAVARLGTLADADAAEVKAARGADRDVRRHLAPLAGLFTLLAASRLDRALAEDLQRGIFMDLAERPDEIPESLHVARGDRRLEGVHAFHFPVEFPEVFRGERGGFDVIVGNPPWEEASIEEDDFWTRHVPGFQGYKQVEQERIKKRWRAERPDLVRQLEAEQAQAKAIRELLLAGPFPGMGKGDPDLYKAFCWRFWALVRPDGGKLGVVLPRSAFAAKGSTEFRRKIFQTGRFLDMTFLLNNQQWIFPEVHPQYTISLVAMERRKPDATATIPMRGPYASEAAFRAGIARPAPRFPVSGVLAWTDTASLPLLPSDESAEVFLTLRRAPRFDHDDGKSWRFRPYRELDATNDKGHMRFTDERPKGFVPVFKGESFDIWQPDTGTYYAYADPKKIVRVLQEKRESSARRTESPWSHLAQADMVREETLPYYSHRIAFRDVTRATDSRTVRAALLPPEVALVNQGPYLIRVRGDVRDEAFVLGTLCSIPLDWFARRFVETHVNYFVLNMLPVPRPNREDARWKRVVRVAGRLAAPDDRFASWAKAVGVEHGPLTPRRKDDLVAELDALVAHLYGLTEAQLVHVFETFHEGGGPVDRLPAVLEHFRALGDAR